MPFPVFNSYEEEEIQAIVARLFEARGYIVRYQHIADRSREKGADLIASKTGESEKVVIQVKKKPSGSDIKQLRDLAERPERTKKYVYFEEPSTDFSNEMLKYSNIIDFWNGEKLIREILPDDPYLALLLLVSDTQTARYLTRIRSLLLKIYDETDSKKLEELRLAKPTTEMIRLLWQAKNRACSFSKGLAHMAQFFDQTDRKSSALITKDLHYTAEAFVRTVAGFQVGEAEQLHESFAILNKQFREYIEYACVERRLGTEWLYLRDFWFLLPRSVEPTLHLLKQYEEKTQDFLRKAAISDLATDTSIFEAMHTLSNEMARLGIGFEGVINDIWRYALNGLWEAGHET